MKSNNLTTNRSYGATKREMTRSNSLLHSPARVSPFELQASSFVSIGTTEKLRLFEEEMTTIQNIAGTYHERETVSVNEMLSVRMLQAERFYRLPCYEYLRDKYPVSLQSETMAGVYTEVFTPGNAVKGLKQDVVLINIHGGSFRGGSRTFSHLESVPVASIGSFNVVSIDYRLAPEYQHPAAKDDLLAVYKALLERYEPDHIGIFGCSAGAILTTQLIYECIQQNLPLPKAVGLLFGACYYWAEGDSGQLATAIQDYSWMQYSDSSYFKCVDRYSEKIFAGINPEILARFPPTLLMTSVRDYTLSSVAYTHTQLSKLGVQATLHVWEGLGHAFHYCPYIDESFDAHKAVTDFFNQQMADS